MELCLPSGASASIPLSNLRHVAKWSNSSIPLAVVQGADYKF